MTFANLHSDTNCDCIVGAHEDFESAYGIKADKSDLREVDFKTKWEKGKRPEETGDCKTVVLLKGKSMSVITSDNIDFLKSLYSQMGNIAPKYKAFLITMKFNDETGIVRRSPSRDNPHHVENSKIS